MTTPELYINNERADLSDSNPIAITLQVNDLADLADRQSTYSNSIKLPKTAKNKRLFGYADSDSFTQDTPYEKNETKYVADGVELITYGNIQLQTVSDYFEAQLTYGLVGINDLLKITEGINIRDAKLKDLDWSDIPNFDMSNGTKATSQTSTTVVFPLVDYGNTLTASSTINTTYLRPGVYFYQFINRIADYIGYEFKGIIFSDTQYLTDLVLFSQTDLVDYQGNLYYETFLPLSVVNNVPDFTLRDFLKDFMQRYFLTPIVDNYKKTITFKSFDELYNNKPTSTDWTDKFIDDARTDEFILDGYSQVNYLKWKADEKGNYNGDGILSINNANLKLNTDLLTSIFAASGYKAGVLGGQTVAQVKKFPTTPLPNYGVIPTIATEPRIVNIRNAAPGTYAFDGGGSIIYQSAAKIGFFSDQGTDGIGWDDQLFKYGTGLKSLLLKCRVITRYVLLKPTDLFNFDFFTPVYDAREAKYYYVNSINNYVAGNKCKVQMIRM